MAKKKKKFKIPFQLKDEESRELLEFLLNQEDPSITIVSKEKKPKEPEEVNSFFVDEEIN